MPHYHGKIRPRMQEPVLLSDVSPGPNYAVTLTETKLHLRVDHTDDDDYIDTLIASAHEFLSGWNGELGKVLVTQTWRTDYDMFPRHRRLDLPLGPVQSVTVKYYDSDNALQTLAASKYADFEDAAGLYLWLDEAEDHWPDTYEREDAVQVTTVVGYGDNPADVPKPIRIALFHMISDWYHNRESVVVGQSVDTLPMAARALLHNLRRPAF